MDHDWNLPIGYVFLQPDEIRGWKLPGFGVVFWTRSLTNSSYQPHIFHNGTEVGKKFMDAEEVARRAVTRK